MRPEDLKSPFTWAERNILIKDRIFYVVDCEHESYDFPGWEDLNIFGNSNPVNIEYCSGNGAWIAAKASADPRINWVAVEMKFSRVRKIWSKIKNLNLNNLFIVCGEAFDVTSRFFPSKSINEVFINFPDPWPKRRHAKNRLIQMPFVNNVWRVLRDSATFNFVTDDPHYSSWTSSIVNAHLGFESYYPSPYYITEEVDYGSSYFERLWREKGKIIRYHKFVKREKCIQNTPHFIP